MQAIKRGNMAIDVTTILSPRSHSASYSSTVEMAVADLLLLHLLSPFFIAFTYFYLSYRFLQCAIVLSILANIISKNNTTQNWFPTYFELEDGHGALQKRDVKLHLIEFRLL